MEGFLHQPNIDPVLIHLWGPFQIRWYSLLYVGGFIVGRMILRKLAKDPRFQFTQEDVEQLVLWLLISAVVGARIVYCVVYDPKNLLANPLYLFQVYRGGLSFHGSLIGVVIAAMVFAKKKGISALNLLDAMALATPPGLAMGRMGNFINGELFGRPTTSVPWAMIFKDGGPQPRHPSQLYEFFLEGVVLMAALWIIKKYTTRDGIIGCAFGIGYSMCRFTAECFREPDAQVGYLFGFLTMGQILSLIQIAMVCGLLAYVLKRPTTVRPS